MPVQCTGCGKQVGWGSALTTSDGEEKSRIVHEGARREAVRVPSPRRDQSHRPSNQDQEVRPEHHAGLPPASFTYGQQDAMMYDRNDKRTSTSDGRAKRDVSEGTKRESGMAGALGALNAVTYDYKDPERDGWGKHAGIIAQDAQEHPIAALMVEQDPHDGRLVLDNKKALSFSLAAAADLDKRMRAVEGKGGRRG